MELKRLFLLDAYALIFRAYYALIKSPRFSSSGMNTSAVFGFVNTLEDLLRRERPDYLAVCFDPEGGTFRHEAFADYKGEREATPEDIKLSIPIIKEIIAAYRIPMLEVAGFEADDVIGSMAVRAEGAGVVTYMVTPDKDFGQLVTERILQYKPAYRGGEFEVRGPKEVCERYGLVSPRQVIDLLALMGDKVDNIPGCPGVGEKTAVKLIGEFGSVENLIASTVDLKGALKRKVEENADKIMFSKFLATIRTDVPIAVSAEDLAVCEPDMDALGAIFERLEFKQLGERVTKRVREAGGGAEGVVSKVVASSSGGDSMQLSLFDDMAGGDCAATQHAERCDVDGDYVLPGVGVSLDDVERRCREAGVAGICVLTSGVSDVGAVPWGVSLSVSEGEGVYLPLSVPGVAEMAARIYADADIVKVSGDVKRDYVTLRSLAGDFVPTNYFDVGVAHYLIEPERKHGLGDVAEHISGLSLRMPAATLPKKRGGEKDSLALLGEEDRGVWGCRCADVALRLHEPLKRKLTDLGMDSLLADVELPLVVVLADMEMAGVRIDVEALNEAADGLRHKIEEIEQEVYGLAGEEFNVSSPAKVGDILFGKLALDPKAKKTRTGQYSTSEEVLEKLVGAHPIVPLILEYRKLKKLLTTYLTALPECINPATGKIHTMYNQTVTATGRISSSSPNLQNIPVRDDVGREIRRAFIPDKGNLFLSADYSQIELRLVADFANDATMLDAFEHGKDIHAITASKIYKEPLDSVTSTQRRAAKTANFGILYGISAFGLASRLSISRGEAKALIDGYFATFPAVHDYMNSSIERARERGYVETVRGRRRMLPDINSRNAVVRGYAERNAINAPIQGSAADIMKIAMIDVARRMNERHMRSKMIMQVHDELNFDVVPEELDELRTLVRECMENAYGGRVRLEVSVGVGSDWLSAH